MYASKNKSFNKSKSRVNDLSFAIPAEPTIKVSDHINPLAAMKNKPNTNQQQPETLL